MKNLKIEFKWAIIFVITTLIWMTLEKLVGLHDEHIAQHPIYTNLFAIPAIIMYVLALRDKRNNFYEGTMTYQQGFVTGLIMTVIIAVLSPLAQYIVSTVITPEYFPNAIRYAVNEGLLSQEQAEAQFNLQSYMIQGVIGALIMGVLTSAIVALFVRRRSTIEGA